MTRTYFLTGIICLLSIYMNAQVLPSDRATNWASAGLHQDTLTEWQEIDLSTYGLFDNGITSNDSIILSVLNSLSDSAYILKFPTGQFLFNKCINLPSNVILRGEAPTSTTLEFDIPGVVNCIQIRGNQSKVHVSITDAIVRNSNVLKVADANHFSAGDWIRLLQDDNHLVTSSWANNSVGQIIQIDSIIGDELVMKSPIRLDYDLQYNPRIKKLNVKENVGIECLKVERLNDTSPNQTSNIIFENAVNSWVKSIESDHCNFTHVDISFSSNIYIAHSYFHHGFNYGSGGRAYGVTIQYSSGECLVENNIFNYLRHAMLLQAGANGNVYAYNYSTNATWSSFPNDAAGDMVLHGNYPYLNLFEHNIGENIIIDNSHGPNGPYNTFFRNRAVKYGIIFTANNSPKQNIIGNEITNDNFPYNVANYSIRGADQFLYSNNVRGNIIPNNTSSLTDTSYYREEIPDFLEPADWGGIGTPSVPETNFIPSYNRFQNNNLFQNGLCEEDITTSYALQDLNSVNVTVYPNPTNNFVKVLSTEKINRIRLVNIFGQSVSEYLVNENEIKLDLSEVAVGTYFLAIEMDNKSAYNFIKLIKVN